MVTRRTDEVIATAEQAGCAVRELVASAKRTRGGGWSLENLLDAIFMIESAALIQRSELIKQNVVIIELLEGMSENQG